ncbi:MAG: hypothetical protein WBV55_11180 [Candidatus Sulfotelmatobacter sp.]
MPVIYVQVGFRPHFPEISPRNAAFSAIKTSPQYQKMADYRIVVIKDCCADPDAEVHACLMDKVFPRQATIASASDLLDTLKSTP